MGSRRSGLLLACVLTAVAGAYAGALEGGFVWDDGSLILENPLVTHPPSVLEPFRRDFWALPLRGVAVGRGLDASGPSYYRPLVTLSFALDWRLGGGAPFAFHLTNVLAHLGVVALVFALARRLGAAASGAAAAAALFGLFPRLTESVTWVSGRTDVFAALGVLGALFLDSRRAASAPAPRGGVAEPVGVGTLLLGGLFSKEVALAGVVAVLAHRFLRALRSVGGWRAKATASLPALVALGSWLAARLAAGGEARAAGLGPGAAGAGALLQAPGEVLRAVGAHARLVAWPWCPSAQQGLAAEADPWAVGLGLALLLAGAVGAGTLARRRRALEAGLLLGALAALALPGVARLALPTASADRFLYLPLALAAPLAGVALSQAPARLAVAAALAASFGVATWWHQGVWSDELRFWRHTVAHAHPLNPGPLRGLGDALFDRFRFEEALDAYERALAVARSSAPGSAAATELAVAATLSRLGRDDQALLRVERLLAVAPGWRRAALDRAAFRARALDFEGAFAALDALEREGGADEASRGLRGGLEEARAAATGLGSERAGEAVAVRLARARLFDELGATERARALYREVGRRSDAAPDARWRALAWLALRGEPAEARAALTRLRGAGPAPGGVAAAGPRPEAAGELEALTHAVDERLADELQGEPRRTWSTRAGTPSRGPE